MWPLYQPIKILEILKYCEISWDFPKKYFYLKSNAVYNSSAKNGGCTFSTTWRGYIYVKLFISFEIKKTGDR